MTEGLKATKKLKRDKGSNPSDAAALPRRVTSPDSVEADCLVALMPDLRRFEAKEPNIHSSHTQQELQSTLAPIAKESCQPSKARMTEGLKATKKLKRDKGSNPSDAAALPRHATSPGSGETRCSSIQNQRNGERLKFSSQCFLPKSISENAFMEALKARTQALAPLCKWWRFTYLLSV